MFTPMLHEVAASDLDMTHIVNPIRKLLKRVKFFEGEIEYIDLPAKRVGVRRTGVANILGINFSGFIAWWLWRMIYLSKLPRFEKKVRVMLDWTLDILFSKDLVQFTTFRSPTVFHSHEEMGRTEARSRAG